MTSPLPNCRDCLDEGWQMVDGKPSACHCPAGLEFAKRAYPGRGPWQSPNHLPPGGDVMARESARRVAGLPPGALDGVPVRAMLVDDAVMQTALEHVARLAGQLEEDNPARVRAAEWLGRLPEAYRLTMPAVAAPRRRDRQTRRRGAAPVAPPV